ncbi:hypothetical protein [Streptomyces nanshensis]|uniref:Hydrogenase expression protein HypF n=1 Tax=Streptomyces nanshensis TaxID=518642 RepID=A0A1E7L6D4_9ACTN|nr:hypothetical protein [Streptomyces nanshensis]OEV11775.1 hypothetical protein AN218_11540 [Streptomyces nanshensis]
MPGDEVHEEAVPSAQQASDAGRGRIGPRHAAPRKPLLNRLHVPAGKAIAIAAMPSAVLMGMGLTPQLASAKPLPKNPFKGGACVSQPDKDENAQEKAEEAAKEKAAREKAEREKEKDEQNGGSDSSKPQPDPSDDSGSADGGGTGGGTGGSGSQDPEPSPSPSDPGDDDEDDDGGGLLGGVGDAIGDIFNPKKDKDENKDDEEKKEEDKASPSPSASGSSSSADKPVEDTVGKVGDGLKDTTGKLGKGLEDAGKGAKGTLPSAGDDEAGNATDKDGKKAFPCVEEKKSAGKDEQTPNMLPNDPWNLEASSLGLHGLDYKGVVNIRTQDGRTKQALKFTASSLDIGDLHQIVKGPNGTTYHVRASQGSTSTIRGGQVTMYTEELKGNLFGLIPITFDPEHPPPLNIPEAYFTNVKVKQAGQFGGNLTVPGLQQSIE